MQGGNVLKFCTGCGAQVPDGSNFCNICGKELDRETNTIPSPPVFPTVSSPPTGGYIERARKYKSFNVYIVLMIIFILFGIGMEGISGAFSMVSLFNFFWIFYAIIKPQSGTFGFVSSRIGVLIIFSVIIVGMGMIGDSIKPPVQTLGGKASTQTQPPQHSNATANKVASIQVADLDKKAQENDALFSNMYENKTLVLSGKIDKIQFENKQVEVSFKGTKVFWHAVFPEDEAVLFAKIDPGQVITFSGTIKRNYARYDFCNSKLIEPIVKDKVMKFKPYDLFKYLYKADKGATINQRIILIKNAEINSITQSDDKTRQTISLKLSPGWRNLTTYVGRKEIDCIIKNNKIESDKFYSLKKGDLVSISGKFIHNDTRMNDIGRDINWNIMTDCEIIQ